MTFYIYLPVYDTGCHLSYWQSIYKHPLIRLIEGQLKAINKLKDVVNPHTVKLYYF